MCVYLCVCVQHSSSAAGVVETRKQRSSDNERQQECESKAGRVCVRERDRAKGREGVRER